MTQIMQLAGKDFKALMNTLKVLEEKIIKLTKRLGNLSEQIKASILITKQASYNFKVKYEKQKFYFILEWKKWSVNLKTWQQNDPYAEEEERSIQKQRKD